MLVVYYFRLFFNTNFLVREAKSRKENWIMGEFKPITTQEEFNSAIAERLSRQKESILKDYSDYDDLKKENESLKHELSDTKSVLEKNKLNSDEFNSRIEELQGKINSYELKNLKTDIALKKGIPYELAGRLVGDTEEDLMEDAKNLSNMLVRNEPVAPLASVEPIIDDEDSAYRNLVRNLDLQGE